MAVVVVDQQKNLQDLTQGLLLSRASRVSRAQAEDAIRAANPGLDLRRLTRGQVLVVPDLPQARAGVVDHVESSASAVTAVLGEQLDELVGSLQDARDAQEQRVEESSAALRQPGLRRLTRDVETKAVVDELRRTLAARRRVLSGPSADTDALVKGWRDEIATLSALAGGR